MKRACTLGSDWPSSNRNYVKAGGTLVCQEPEKLGLPRDGDSPRPVTTPCLESQFDHGKGRVLLLRGSVSETWTDDTGSNFFTDLRSRLQRSIALLLTELGVPVKNAGEVGHPSRQIADIRDVFSTLKASGVNFLADPHLVNRTPKSELWLAEFTDPDGNQLALMSEVALAGA